MTTFVKGFFPVRAHTRRKPLPSADFVATTKALAGFVLSERQQVEDLGDMLIGALIEANLAEPLDGEEFDDLSSDDRKRLREAW